MESGQFWRDLQPSDPEYAVRLVDRMLATAVERHASDIHLHPRVDHWEILFRLDGVLSVIGRVPRSTLTDPVSRLMVLANIPTYKSGQPMEGRLSQSPHDVEMRLGTFPTIHGIRAVVRLFAATDELVTINHLGLPEDVALALVELSESRDGVVLLTGPAGSGKTTTLYACLRYIAASAPRRSVLTIEDPIESVIESISQSQLQPSLGMTLASSLRSAVRQDPEVLLVSEIRDVETAEAVLTSSLTGHLVFSSLHAGDIAAALRRLVQMELPTYLLQSGLRAVCCQRLLRRLCVSCDHQTQDDCEPCGGTGYRGRVAIAELLRLDRGDIGEEMMRGLSNGQSAGLLYTSAEKNGMITLRQRAWQLVDDGVTDEREVYRVLGRAAGNAK
jgi:general secretion pathway protein E